MLFYKYEINFTVVCTVLFHCLLGVHAFDISWKEHMQFFFQATIPNSQGTFLKICPEEP